LEGAVEPSVEYRRVFKIGEKVISLDGVENGPNVRKTLHEKVDVRPTTNVTEMNEVLSFCQGNKSKLVTVQAQDETGYIL
jgi:hypothetical protein